MVERRIAIIGIGIEDRESAAQTVNLVLAQHGDSVVGRLGIPYRERNLSVIALIVDATTDELGALTGKLGRITGVKVKSAVIF
jgi:putative iron-only hydrogenase system regulator